MCFGNILLRGQLLVQLPLLHYQLLLHGGDGLVGHVILSDSIVLGQLAILHGVFITPPVDLLVCLDGQLLGVPPAGHALAVDHLILGKDSSNRNLLVVILGGGDLVSNGSSIVLDRPYVGLLLPLSSFRTAGYWMGLVITVCWSLGLGPNLGFISCSTMLLCSMEKALASSSCLVMVPVNFFSVG